MQEQMVCPRHPGSRIVRDGEKLSCHRCTEVDYITEPATLITIKELWGQWEQENLLSFNKLMASVDHVIMEFLWAQKDGTLVNLFLYFNVKARPVNPREFLEFWDSVDESEQDYYMLASAEELRNEAEKD